MKNVIKTYWKTLLFFGAVGLIGGFATGLYVLDSYPAPLRQQLLDQGMTPMMLALVSAVQAAGYGIVLGAIGIFFGKKTGLWRDERHLTKGPLIRTAAVAVVGGAAMILPDLLFFVRHSQVLLESYAAKPTFVFILGAMTYGAVIEEVMLRLFFLSVLAFVIHRLFGKKGEMPTAALLILANVIAACLFAAGHLPGTFQLLGSSPVIIFRCLLLNGVFGFAFGELYRKYGLRYAMLAHGGCHLVSKLLWIVLI